MNSSWQELVSWVARRGAITKYKGFSKAPVHCTAIYAFWEPAERLPSHKRQKEKLQEYASYDKCARKDKAAMSWWISMNEYVIDISNKISSLSVFRICSCK